MRSAVKNSALSLAAVLTVILLNIFVLYSSVLSADIVQNRSIYKAGSSESISELRIKRRLISGISGDYPSHIRMLEDRIKELNKYQTAVHYMTSQDSTLLYCWSDIPAAERPAKAQELYNAALLQFTPDRDALSEVLDNETSAATETAEYLRYLAGYGDYICGITDRSDFLADISIYKRNSSVLANILNTRRDFYGLENITLTPVCETGFTLFLNYRTTDIFAALIPLISLAALRNSRRKSLLAPMLITAFGAVTMYLTNFFLIGKYFGMPPAETAVQSMESFKSCPYMINSGTAAALVILSKTAGCLLILFIASAAFFSSGKKRIAAILLTVIPIAAEAFFALSPDISAVLKEINILSFFSFERFFIRYLNIDIFGLSIARLPVFLVFGAAVIAALWAYSANVLRSRTKALILESEQEYYSEINRRYNECRSIRHDISNHLLAISALIENGDIEAAKRYVSEVSEQALSADMPVKTGCNVLDALLFKKTEQAAERGCKISFEINCPINGCGISDFDLCTIFGNALDNAIEAAGNDDSISIKIGKQLDMLYISCKNPFSGDLKRRGDRIITTKKDLTAHGFGIMRIKETARHYGGDVNITAENGIFSIEILLNTK